MDLKTKYTIKGIGKEQTIESVVKIHTEGEKIVMVEDKWSGELPEGAFAKVSFSEGFLNFKWWFERGERWGWWVWSFFWETRVWEVGRSFHFDYAFKGGFGRCVLTLSRRLEILTRLRFLLLLVFQRMRRRMRRGKAQRTEGS